MTEVAIDLTWVRHGKVGGTESCVRNLLDGFAEINPKDFVFRLILSEENAASFHKYSDFECFKMAVLSVSSQKQYKRVLWQNIKLGKYLNENNIRLCLEPVYGKPFFGTGKTDFITIIHDLQALHYPQYFSRGRVAWMKIAWMNAVKSSKKIVAISNFVKEDVEKHFPESVGKTVVIYDAVKINTDSISGKEFLRKYGVKEHGYYYTVSSLFLHKNLATIILAIAKLKEQSSEAFAPLIISGIGGRKREKLDQLIREQKVQDEIIFTSFIDDAERNMLYKYCKAFLFPSIFEGFGMPPIEAASFDVPVLTTRCTSIEEVTGGLLNYVDDPTEPNNWIKYLTSPLSIPKENEIRSLIQSYSCKSIAEQFIELFKSIN